MWPAGTVFCLVVAVVAAAWPTAGAWMVGEREALRAGEAWRVWTAHGVHFSWSHLGWSGLLWLVAGGLMERESRRAWTAAVLAGAPLITVAALWLDPQAARYGGLSGLACVPLVWLGLGWAWEAGGGMRRAVGAGVLLAVAAKVAWEFYAGSGATLLASFEGGSGEVRSAPWAHVAGAMAGAVLRVVMWGTGNLDSRPSLPRRVGAS